MSVLDDLRAYEDTIPPWRRILGEQLADALDLWAGFDEARDSATMDLSKLSPQFEGDAELLALQRVWEALGFGGQYWASRLTVWVCWSPAGVKS